MPTTRSRTRAATAAAPASAPPIEEQEPVVPSDVICLDLSDGESTIVPNQSHEEDDGNDSDFDIDDRRPAKRAKVKTEGATKAKLVEVKSEKIASSFNHFPDSEIQEVAAPALFDAEGDVEMEPESAGDDLVVVGSKNRVRLPHSRHDCVDHPFRFGAISVAAIDANKMHCDLCYCYVCDCPADDCDAWCYDGTLMPVRNHCCAHNKDKSWVQMRAMNKGEPIHPIVSGGSNSSVASSTSWTTFNPQSNNNASRMNGVGPYAPDDMAAQWQDDLTKCRYCGWHSRLSATWNKPMHADWCHACGRVAAQKCAVSQSHPFESAKGSDDVYLGTKTFAFRIHAHDPREFPEFQDRWAESQWQFDDARAEEDVFRHRVGQRPFPSTLLRSIPSVNIEALPSSGLVRGRSGAPNATNVSADEIDYLILDDEQFDGAVLLLQLLKNSNEFGQVRTTRGEYGAEIIKPLGGVGGDIVGAWDAASRTGTFTIRVFLGRDCFRNGGCSFMTELLGAWCGLLPIPVGELSGLLRAVAPAGNPHYSNRKPIYLNGARNIKDDDVTQLIRDSVHGFNLVTDERSAALTLTASNKKAISGGISAASNSFQSNLVRYYTECFPRKVASFRTNRFDYDRWLKVAAGGSRSDHRNLALNGGSIDLPYTSGNYGDINLEIVLSPKDHALASTALAQSGRDMISNYEGIGIQGIMDALENLGHAPSEPVDGLNIELLGFQRQCLQWAIDRERVPGGIQTFFRQKLPVKTWAGDDLYYDFILKKVSKTPPQVVRGGIIAAEMGLGKTIVSLGLCLQNPAPLLPESGSPIQSIAAEDVAPCAWNQDLYAQTAKEDKQRGSILSRGTLVVCPVSLVGQWISEAKSKLKDPGLIYPYHGQSRVRDADVLAQNAIVVTTYQVLASDATYHAKKAKAKDDYCPPLEKVRWWRIIADEGHSLKSSSTSRFTALMSLVADHKWVVTGTPMNTAVNDLKNQLKFVGVEDIGNLFSRMDVKPPPKRRRRYQSSDVGGNIPRLLFFLREIMIRYAQNQTYRNTNTTLMSLPPKKETSIELEFDKKEKAEYDMLEEVARARYLSFKRNVRTKLGTHTLAITQAMAPIRIACAGGHYPLPDQNEAKKAANDDDGSDDGDEDHDGSDDEDEAPKRKEKKIVHYSDFAFRTKLKELLRLLEETRDNDPSSKSLIFSQYTSTLEWLQSELPKHGFQFRTLSGSMSMKQRAKALDEFQNDPPTTIFLLSMRAGAVGINLTQANRVYLMEPSVNPALESQAVGRVHRLGQKREVEIIRLVVKDSIESRLVSLMKKKYGNAVGGPANEDDKAPAVPVEASTRRKEAPVGSIATEKSVLLEQEFDFLLGVDKAVSQAAAVAPDAVNSTSNADRSEEEDDQDKTQLEASTAAAAGAPAAAGTVEDDGYDSESTLI